jgi:hypothetical protein
MNSKVLILEAQMDLAQFLVKAKQNTYASGQSGKKLADGSEEFEIREGEFRYLDRFLGSSAFIGQELVWHSDRLIWGMNYYGALTADVPPQFGDFLKKALRGVSEERPFRGPHLLLEDDFEYVDESQGDISSFTGVEMILLSGSEVYRLAYHGGHLD